eukprot:521413-Hanusia_phi.AAC.1
MWQSLTCSTASRNDQPSRQHPSPPPPPPSPPAAASDPQSSAPPLASSASSPPPPPPPLLPPPPPPDSSASVPLDPSTAEEDKGSGETGQQGDEQQDEEFIRALQEDGVPSCELMRK